MNSKLTKEELKEVKEYLSDNRSEYGLLTGKIPNNKTIYGNLHGLFGMSDGNSLYVLDTSIETVTDSIELPSKAIESDELKKIYEKVHTLCEMDRFTTKLESDIDLVNKALEEYFVSKELLDSLGIKDDEYIYKLNMNIFKKNNTLYFNRKQIEFYLELLGATVISNHTWDKNILYGKSALGKGYVYTKKTNYK